MAQFFRNPNVEVTASAARAAVLDAIEQATAAILDAYPRAERLAWDSKEAEAVAFAAAAEPDPADYPLLRGELAAELTIAASDVTLEQLADRAEAVLWLASRMRAIVAAASGIRKRAEAAIAAAEDDAGRRTVVEAVRGEISVAVSL